MYVRKVAYTGQVTFDKVSEQHGHVYQVGLYIVLGNGHRFTKRYVLSVSNVAASKNTDV